MDEIAREVTSGKEKARAIIKARMEARRQRATTPAVEDIFAREARIKAELAPPPRAFALSELFITIDKKDWLKVQPNNIGYALPFPIQNPKAFYIVPRISTSGQNLIRDAFNKIYAGLKENQNWEEYVIERAAWISARVLQRANFNIWQIEPGWEAEGEKGIVRKIK